MRKKLIATTLLLLGVNYCFASKNYGDVADGFFYLFLLGFVQIILSVVTSIIVQINDSIIYKILAIIFNLPIGVAGFLFLFNGFHPAAFFLLFILLTNILIINKRKVQIKNTNTA